MLMLFPHVFIFCTGLASFKLINEMRRNAKIDESGFMVPLDDQVIEEEKVKVLPEETENQKGTSGSPKRAAPKSPRKLKETLVRKESIRAKANDPKHNWKILSDTIGFTKEEIEEHPTSNTTVSSDSFDEKLNEKENPSGKIRVRRSRSPVKKK